jgi:hypothetical protein
MGMEHDTTMFIFLVDEVVEPQAVLLKKSGILQTMEVDQSCSITLQYGLQAIGSSRNARYSL